MVNKILTPTQIRELCRLYDLTPSKQYGQNYLLSEKVIEQMVVAGELTKDDTVVEIGPGFGILTFALAEKAKKVIAFEIEKKLEPYWNEILETRNKKLEIRGQTDNIEIIWGNVLNNWELEIRKLGNYKVLANLPYQVTSQALRTILESERKPERIVVMLQKEVAERITAGKGEMSLLALSVQYYGVPKIVCQVPRGSFWPVPKVDSAVVAIDLSSPEHLSTLAPKHIDNGCSPSAPVLGCCSAEVFFKVARAGFAMKRKQLWKNISHGLKMDERMVKDAVLAVAGDEKARAEDLSISEWVELVVRLENSKFT